MRNEGSTAFVAAGLLPAIESTAPTNVPFCHTQADSGDILHNGPIEYLGSYLHETGFVPSVLFVFYALLRGVRDSMWRIGVLSLPGTIAHEHPAWRTLASALRRIGALVWLVYAQT